MQISIEKPVEIIVQQVLAELRKHGVEVETPATESVVTPAVAQTESVEIDMTGYRTPVLTENRVRSVERHVREIFVSAGTICTIGARDAMRQRAMILTYTGKKT